MKKIELNKSLSCNNKIKYYSNFNLVGNCCRFSPMILQERERERDSFSKYLVYLHLGKGTIEKL